jgi:protease I
MFDQKEFNMKHAQLFCLILLALCLLGASHGEEAELIAEQDLSGKHVAILVGEGFHDGETYIPMGYVANLGAKVTVIGLKPGVHKAYNSDITVTVHSSVSDVSVEDFEALIIPG